MNRADFQTLSNRRVAEARVLLDAGEYTGSRYIMGYAIECALKACIAKNVKRFDFPPRESASLYVHKLEDLFKHAQLRVTLGGYSAVGLGVRAQGSRRDQRVRTSASRAEGCVGQATVARRLVASRAAGPVLPSRPFNSGTAPFRSTQIRACASLRRRAVATSPLRSIASAKSAAEYEGLRLRARMLLNALRAA